MSEEWTQPRPRRRGGQRGAPTGSRRPAGLRLPESGPIVLLMVGAQGSGKSTFADELVRSSAAPWTRISQDVLGSRQRCLAAASEALEAGRSIVIDRCNFDAKQRSSFIAVAKERGCPVLALVLALPLETCLARAVGRMGHEGGIQGQMAERIVQITGANLRKAGLPKTSEGIDAVAVRDREREGEGGRGVDGATRPPEPRSEGADG